MASPRDRSQQAKRRPTQERTGRPRTHASSSADNLRTVELTSPDDWAPSPSATFKLFLVPSLVAAIWSCISDCDETFNYWEPTHFLMKGYGFQTWEFSPVYAIRSYAYNMPHLFPGFAIGLFFDKVTVFYGIRVVLGVICAACQSYFYSGVLARFGSLVAQLLLIFLLFGAGMFISSAAYLPSSFAMYMVMVAMGAWFQDDMEKAVGAIAAAALLGWPFAAVLGVPIAVDILYRFGVWHFVKMAGTWGLVLLIPQVAVDSFLYRYPVLAPLNIVLYNVFGEGGPDLYGVEPWTYYFVNAFLNFNIVFLLALIVLPVWGLHMLLRQSRPTSEWTIGKPVPVWLALMPMYVWIAIFFTRPHKEERFLFPIYPLFCLSAAVVLIVIQEICSAILWQWRKIHHGWIMTSSVVCVTLLYTALSVSRSVAVFQGYHAPLDIYKQLSHHAIKQSDSYPHFHFNVCVGKEWYRFPSNFFLPDMRWQLRFIRSEFRGQLPQPYGHPSNGTWVIPSHMNDMNREETSRYTAVGNCHYLVDLDLGKETQREPRYAQQTKRWKVIASEPFLDAAQSHPFFRAFFVPWLSEKYTKYANYTLLQVSSLDEQLRMSIRKYSPHGGH